MKCHHVPSRRLPLPFWPMASYNCTGKWDWKRLLYINLIHLYITCISVSTADRVLLSETFIGVKFPWVLYSIDKRVPYQLYIVLSLYPRPPCKRPTVQLHLSATTQRDSPPSLIVFDKDIHILQSGLPDTIGSITIMQLNHSLSCS